MLCQFLKFMRQTICLLYHPICTSNCSEQILAVHREGETRLLGPEDALDGGNVLPGFRFELRRLFPDESFDSSE